MSQVPRCSQLERVIGDTSNLLGLLYRTPLPENLLWHTWLQQSIILRAFRTLGSLSAAGTTEWRTQHWKERTVASDGKKRKAKWTKTFRTDRKLENIANWSCKRLVMTEVLNSKLNTKKEEMVKALVYWGAGHRKMVLYTRISKRAKYIKIASASM